ncbi:tyrosine-type recombinase/integrase [Deinococcus sp. HSC-46F16]|uniref:tyrosine-type recombinase/integrase n=1 Tax=Deinococcus sp. HSC-46F16 TaxID=2910968 RepID=UPI003531EA95
MQKWVNDFHIEMHKEGKLPSHIRFQLRDCRRIVATKLHENGVSILEISKFLGHRSISTTTGYIASDQDRIIHHLNDVWKT